MVFFEKEEREARQSGKPLDLFLKPVVLLSRTPNAPSHVLLWDGRRKTSFDVDHIVVYSSLSFIPKPDTSNHAKFC